MITKFFSTMSRAHAENFPIVLGEVMNKWDSFCSKASSNNQSTPKLKYIAVTIGPGLYIHCST